jgi:hypothetical protein
VSSCAILQDEIARLKAQKKILETQKAGHTDDMAKLTVPILLYYLQKKEDSPLL